MEETVPVLKDENNQMPIPGAWRNTLFDIVEALKEGDFGLARQISGVSIIPEEKATKIADNIKSYGCQLVSLPEATWQTSVCQWMGDHWSVLVDLYTVEEGASDLVLDASVYEGDLGYGFDVHFVYVP